MIFPAEHLRAEIHCTALEIRPEGAVDESNAMEPLFADYNWEIAAEIRPVPTDGASYGWR